MSSHVLFTIFGASGDLAKRKLYPSLFRLYKAGHIRENFAVIGTARRPWTKEFLNKLLLNHLETYQTLHAKPMNLPAISTIKVMTLMIRSIM